jgi:hypothetical protein
MRGRNPGLIGTIGDPDRRGSARFHILMTSRTAPINPTLDYAMAWPSIRILLAMTKQRFRNVNSRNRKRPLGVRPAEFKKFSTVFGSSRLANHPPSQMRIRFDVGLPGAIAIAPNAVTPIEMSTRHGLESRTTLP